VCHPHPQYGGDMQSPVVVRVAEALAASGVATLRFNFGGVGASEGAYDGGRAERCDVGAAESALAAEVPAGTPLAVVGYSFGAWVGAAAAPGLRRVRHVVAIAPPLAMLEWSSSGPLDVVVGDRDQYCPRDALARLDAARTTILPGADHFLVGRENEVAAAVVAALR
jgi:alpha/beta superfamily hydrolase